MEKGHESEISNVRRCHNDKGSRKDAVTAVIVTMTNNGGRVLENVTILIEGMFCSANNYLLRGDRDEGVVVSISSIYNAKLKKLLTEEKGKHMRKHQNIMNMPMFMAVKQPEIAIPMIYKLPLIGGACLTLDFAPGFEDSLKSVKELSLHSDALDEGSRLCLKMQMTCGHEENLHLLRATAAKDYVSLHSGIPTFFW